MDWFERITGFRECGYQDTQSKLAVEGAQLRSRANGKVYGIGRLRIPTLGELRNSANSAKLGAGNLTIRLVSGDVRAMHRDTDNATALFQVASQFNLLEMVSPNVTPDMGVTRYASDPTQGPACAIAAGAATIFRNYFAPVGDQQGQTAERQVDCLNRIGQELETALGRPVSELWEMRNGYALCTADGLRSIARHLESLDEDSRDSLGATLQIGLHEDVEITDGFRDQPVVVSQAFCSALPVAYSGHPKSLWEPFARLVLEAAYEATLLCGVLNMERGRSNRVLLTALGGGAFGNDPSWIHDAMVRALDRVKEFGLDVRLVSYGSPRPMYRAIVDRFP
ncbi:hypothetical protein V1286_007640 [Bradyrhizobium algeriense]|uniref:Macro domain-containing protein n=1 Tax=Bradyrhizobium algeriense TaxID=634784 RepID=A0ABU8BNH4_9BRAD